MSIFHQEDYYGKIEYKRYFNEKDQERLDKYATQLNFRINEGHGEAIYLIGVNDDGSIYGLNDYELKRNINTLSNITKLLNLFISLIIWCNYKEKKFLICKVKSINFDENLIL
tara:strand:- start:9 stop:347 length:339 start_codon:yes stop_codon:yes gene_type:complete